ncbi:MAG: helicase C-terminal domain-containing protein, partial [Oleibacter sp.]|nr:helicase C-terminal domain-containing protein [Thalassolituus sp.]
LDMGVRSQRQWLKQLEKGLDQFITQAGIPNSLMHSLREVPDHIRTLNQQVSLCWPLVLDLIGESDRLRFEFGRMPDSLRDLLETMRSPILPIVQCLDKLNDLLQKSLDPKEDSEIGRDIAESWQAPIGMMLSRAEAMSEALSWLAGEETAEQIPVARWLSRSPYGDDSDIIISASPISVAAQLRRNLWERAYGAVVTSATLTALDSFHTLQWESGLPDWAHYERVASPFNYAELGELEAVNLASDPKSDQFQSDVQTWLSEHVNLDEGTLVLFSSRAQLDATREFFIRDWYQSLLSQNYLPKADIVKRHKERIDSGKGSIIFGLASFAEGIDLPGDYLKHVVIVKIPFAVPDDPIHAAVGEWMESRGRNPFMELTLPAASIRLIQACGRLIRKETDRGRVSILDKRLTTSRYGQLLLNSLPPFKRV